MRASISLVVIAVTVAGSFGAVAQSYPPPPPPPTDFYPEPPAPYPADESPQPYTNAPLPADVGGEATQPPSGSVYGPAPSVYRNTYGAPAAPYGVPQQGVASQAPPSPESDAAPRPPADIGGGPVPADVTGSIRNPGGYGTAPAPNRAAIIAALPPEDQPERGPAKELPPQFRRQLVDYATSEPAGTIIIDTPHTYLYLVRGNGKALRYGIGVGREGFTWSGTERIRRMTEWPDWYPPKEMIERQPYLPRFMAGGEGNPLGARALYLGNTLYRIHGTNQPSTIGTFVSSGCIRLTNEDIEDLYSRVNIGTRVVVLPGSPPTSASAPEPVVR